VEALERLVLAGAEHARGSTEAADVLEAHRAAHAGGFDLF